MSIYKDEQVRHHGSARTTRRDTTRHDATRPWPRLSTTDGSRPRLSLSRPSSVPFPPLSPPPSLLSRPPSSPSLHPSFPALRSLPQEYKLLRRILLTTSRALPVEREKYDKRVFRVDTPKRPYFFEADSEAEMHAWIGAINVGLRLQVVESRDDGSPTNAAAADPAPLGRGSVAWKSKYVACAKNENARTVFLMAALEMVAPPPL